MFVRHRSQPEIQDRHQQNFRQKGHDEFLPEQNIRPVHRQTGEPAHEGDKKYQVQRAAKLMKLRYGKHQENSDADIQTAEVPDVTVLQQKSVLICYLEKPGLTLHSQRLYPSEPDIDADQDINDPQQHQYASQAPCADIFHISSFRLIRSFRKYPPPYTGMTSM